MQLLVYFRTHSTNKSVSGRTVDKQTLVYLYIQMCLERWFIGSKRKTDKGTHGRLFSPGDTVFVHIFSQCGPQWFHEHIILLIGDGSLVTYLVKLKDGRVIQGYVNALFWAVA